ncbi:hypothetical protein M427DRAFT_112586 [Gonapodya prolifera JEL478]|uniref:Mitochondrial intermembrane space import and assembly protein 40 n=1 Tax=Gonapodya prolifera (strain JEL478) TaxID=1344416 RepID=A0A139ADA9_GONPJ|nr:hypothetical protein M427DRAFT_112586 [Gonapodya prolifera JEL478]|eukprot:KXS14403.1 hypothetical protein M427DRAFT_112586 [Gonapodya prolifera JEL478]
MSEVQQISSKDTVLFIDKETNHAAIEELERKTLSGGQGAVNSVTGEINWACPCLGDLAVQPPCGDTFKISFACFVRSTTEPKGMDCADAFRQLQGCFREHPEIYGRDAGDD